MNGLAFMRYPVQTKLELNTLSTYRENGDHYVELYEF